MRRLRLFILLTVTLASAPALAQYKVPGRLAGATSEVDEESAFAKTLKRDQIVKKGRMSAFSNVDVETRRGRVKLSTMSRSLFKPQDDIATSLKGARGALYGSIAQEEEVYETQHTFVLRRTLTLPIKDPAVARSASKGFREEFGKMRGTLERRDLTKAQAAAFAQAKSEIQRLPRGNPLKAALAKGDQALLDALTSGVGEVSVSHSFVIPKVAPKITKQGFQVPKVTAGIYDYSQLSLDRAPLEAVDTSKLQPAQMNIVNRRTGETDFTAEFLNGFTEGYDFNWEKRWGIKYVGFFRLTVGAHAGFGIRIPIKVEGTLKPNNVTHRDFEDKHAHFDVELSATTFDAPGSYYSRVGVPSTKVFDGNEAFASMGAGYGYKLSVFGSDLLYRKYKEIQVGPRFDFTPLLTGSFQKVSSYFIPAALTKTGFSTSVFKGSARIGVKLEAKGTIKALLYTFYRVAGSSQFVRTLSVPGSAWPSSEQPPSDARNEQNFTFTGQGQKRAFVGHLPKRSNNQRGTYEFGFVLKNLIYRSDWAITPGLRLDLWAGYKDWTFVDWDKEFWLEDFRVNIGSVELGPHEGTTPHFIMDAGRKYFQMPTPETGDKA
jgi:hypothetical protein